MLQIAFKLTSDNNNSTLFMKILKMPEKWRGKNSICCNNNKKVEIYSSIHPELDIFAELEQCEMGDDLNVIFLPGINRDKDNEVASYTTSSFYYFRLIGILKDITCTLSEFTKNNAPSEIIFPHNRSHWQHTFTWKLNDINKKHPLTTIFT